MVKKPGRDEERQKQLFSEVLRGLKKAATELCIQANRYGLCEKVQEMAAEYLASPDSRPAIVAEVKKIFCVSIEAKHRLYPVAGVCLAKGLNVKECKADTFEVLKKLLSIGDITDEIGFLLFLYLLNPELAEDAKQLLMVYVKRSHAYEKSDPSRSLANFAFASQFLMMGLLANPKCAKDVNEIFLTYLKNAGYLTGYADIWLVSILVNPELAATIVKGAYSFLIKNSKFSDAIDVSLPEWSDAPSCNIKEVKQLILCRIDKVELFYEAETRLLKLFFRYCKTDKDIAEVLEDILVYQWQKTGNICDRAQTLLVKYLEKEDYAESAVKLLVTQAKRKKGLCEEAKNGLKKLAKNGNGNAKYVLAIAKS